MTNLKSPRGEWPLLAVLSAPLVVVALVAGARLSTADEQADPPRANPRSNPLRQPGKRDPRRADPGGVNQAAGTADAPPARTARAGTGVPATPPVESGTAQPGAAPGKEKFNPEQVNGKYFEGWPKPDLALVITGRMDGYLEPCGCAGLEKQMGGVSRRHALLEQLKERGWPIVPIDVGGQVHRYGRQSEIKFNIIVEALKKMGYQAVGFGADDLRLSATEVAAAVAGDNPPDSSLFVSANVGLFELTPRVRVFKAPGGRKLGITSIVGDKYQQSISNPEVELTPAAEALKKALPQLKACDLRILLANATVEESQQLARQFPEFEIVVTSDGGDEPPHRPSKIEGSQARLIEVGHKGMYAVVLGLFNDPKQPSRYQRVALDSRFAGTPEMQQLMVNYQAQLQALGWQGLGLRAVPNPRGQGHEPSWGEYAGAKSCKECHPTAYKIWEKTGHAHATQSLTKATPPRQYDAECVSCHATGWNAQEFFPYASGFASLEATPQLANNGCENCHGPSAAHVKAEGGKNFAKKEELRAVVRLQAGTAEHQVCRKCHDLDNSPDFNFEKWWPKVEHKGKK